MRRWMTATCQPPLVGRASHLVRLKDLAVEVRRGLGRAVWLVGEAGLGKSRLKNALVEQLASDGFEVFEGSGLALPGMPGGAFRELLEATRGLRPPPGVGWVSSADAELLARFLEGRERQGVPASLSAERTALFDALCHALMPHRRPRLLILEDWQHADPFSHALIEVLVSRLSHTPLFLLALQRPGGTAPVPLSAEVVTVGPLSDDEATALLEQRVRSSCAPVTPEVRAALLEAGAGHPLHLLHAITLQEERPELPVPGTGGAVLGARLRALSATQREALQSASVLGPSFPRTVLGALVGGCAPLAPLEAGGWLRAAAGGRYTWAVCLPEGLLGDVAPDSHALHRRAAEAHESLPVELRRRACADLSRHWLSADAPERALPHLLELAGWHRAALETDFALGVYRFALGQALGLEPAASLDWQRVLWERMGDAHRLAGAREDAEYSWRTSRTLDAREPVPPLGDRARRLHKLGSVLFALGRFEEVLVVAEEGQREGVQSLPTLAAGLEADAALALCGLGRFEQARTRLRLARERLRLAPPESGPARAAVEAALHRAMGNVLMGKGQPEQATAEYLAVLRWSEVSGDTWEHSTALLHLGDAHARAGDRERATHFFQLALELESRTGDRWGMAHTHHGLALLHTQADAPELAKEDAVRGLQLASMVGDLKLKSRLRFALGRAQLRLGELEEAGKQLQLAAQDAAAVGARTEQLQAEAALRVLGTRR
ncbi:AAA family ATPase [Pyxidicoccus sp. MSG2]|uniref:AAA family ATPase n=1 Tax=Pyxidicoccus sp. MSG2 TaxID=2996790 RepID=UPI0022717C1B|nr:tetratricopeptide repeat protein [Pyxidicoccus sp. MSG2]MCY1014957.1 AAA family ATPase [Pyxidicoccus sp. MSG2]